MFVKTLYNGRRAFYPYRNKTIPLLSSRFMLSRIP